MENLSSGFIDTEISKEDAFSGVAPIYTSVSGYTCLYVGVRYGKKHILKTLSPSYRSEKFYEQALRKEFAIGYQLEHPHIAHTMGWEVVDGIGPCIIMEYVDGETLRDFMAKGRLTEELARKIIGELCNALQYLHTKQVIHRDLKPENIMITHNGNNVKLIDFSLSDCDDYTLLKLPAGTRYYMAPETLLPDTKADLRADIYSLGIIIGEMASLLKSRHLAAVSRKCTRQAREKRYTSDMAVFRAVWQKPWQLPLRWVAVIAVVMLLGVGGWSLLQSRRSFQTPHYFPVYGNVVEDEACRRILTDEARRLKLDGAVLTASDSIRVMQQISRQLDRTFPQAVMQRTTAYQGMMQYWQNEVAKLSATGKS